MPSTQTGKRFPDCFKHPNPIIATCTRMHAIHIVTGSVRIVPHDTNSYGISTSPMLKTCSLLVPLPLGIYLCQDRSLFSSISSLHVDRQRQTGKQPDMKQTDMKADTREDRQTWRQTNVKTDNSIGKLTPRPRTSSMQSLSQWNQSLGEAFLLRYLFIPCQTVTDAPRTFPSRSAFENGW